MRDQIRQYSSLPMVLWCKQRLRNIYEAQGFTLVSFSPWLFLRALGCIYLIAFVSLWLQVEGLIGSQGILPVKEYHDLLYEKLGPKSYFLRPSLFWLNSSDAMLHFLCACAVLFSCLLIFNILSLFALASLWLFYLSFVSVGQDFLSFQWDALLLEAGFLAIFLAPWQFRSKSTHKGGYSFLFLFLLRWLLFRLMFASGYVKVINDSSWRDLSALSYHYETQPLPTWIAWYAHQLPGWFQEFSVAAMLGIELLIPFFIFGPRRLRNLACFALATLQGLIILTGNYGFFNLLTIALCVLLVDDVTWRKLFSFRKFEKIAGFVDSFTRSKMEISLCKRRILRISALFLFLFSVLQFSAQFLSWTKLPTSIREILITLRPLHIVGTYGLFAHMTKTRPEIIIEGSKDALFWEEYQFKWKPASLHKKPQWVAPHQPRLDWQMWFAALRGNCRRAPWFISFMLKLLQNNSAVTSLLAKNPFPNSRPRYIRSVLYEYQFTNLSLKKSYGRWWKRKELAPYCPILSPKSFYAK